MPFVRKRIWNAPTVIQVAILIFVSATVYGIVAQSEGGITVHSVRARGTTFTVHLPETEPPVPAPVPAIASPARGSGRILVVDDDRAVRTIAARMLAGAGYEIVEAADGLAALEAAAGPVDAILTDLDMPGLGGAALAGRLAATRPDLAIVVMSGYLAEPESLPPGTRVLEKPFTREKLVHIIAEALGG